MIRRVMIGAALAAIALVASAQYNSVDETDWSACAQAMLDDGNPLGALQHIEHALQLPLTEQQLELALWMQADANVLANKPEAAMQLRQFLATYPASIYRLVALADLGDCYLGTNCNNGYEEALNIYNSIDGASLSPNRQSRYYFNKAVAEINLGQYEQASASLTLVKDKSYERRTVFYWGYLSYVQGKMSAAKSMLEQARAEKTDNNMACYYLAQIYYAERNYKQAMDYAQESLKVNGATFTTCKAIATQCHEEALRIAGECAYQLGNNSMARKYLDQYAAETSSPMPSALYILGLYAYQDGNYHKAVQYFTPATGMGDAMSQCAYLYIGQSQLKEADYDGAIMAFDKALNMDFDPEVQEIAYYNYAVASLEGGKVPFGNSVATFESFLKRYPSSPYAPEVQKYIIASYFNDRNYQGAISSIGAMAQPTADTKQALLQAYYLQGATLMAENKPQEAETYLRQARSMSNIDATTALEAALLLGEAQYAQQQYAEAANTLQSYLDKAKRDAKNRAIATYDLGYALFQQKKYAAAEQKFASLLGQSTNLPAEIKADAACRQGDCLYYNREFDSAAKAYDKAVSLNPATGDYPLLQKALMEGYQRNHHKKLELLQQLQRDFPNSALIPDAMLEMTESYLQLGDNASAIATYKRLGSLYPMSAQARQGSLQLALTLLNDGQREQAIQAYKDVIQTYPTSEEAQQAAEALKRIAVNDGWVADYADFIASVPGAPQMDANETESLYFEDAERQHITGQGSEKLEAYLANFPGGSHRAKALSYLVQSATAAGDDSTTYRWACQLIDEYPDNKLALDALMQKASIEERQGKHTLALATWQQLLSKAPSAYYMQQAALGVARAAVEADQAEVAIEAVSRVLSSSNLSQDGRAEALWLRGAAYNRQGLRENARNDWQQAAADKANVHGARSAYWLAQSYYDDNMLAEAEAEAKALTTAATPHAYWVARAFIVLSDIYTKQGQEYKAQQYLKSLRENYPGSEPDIFEMIDARL